MEWPEPILALLVTIISQRRGSPSAAAFAEHAYATAGAFTPDDSIPPSAAVYNYAAAGLQCDAPPNRTPQYIKVLRHAATPVTADASRSTLSAIARSTQ